MFKIWYKVIEIRENGVTITHHLYGYRKNVMADVENFKKDCKKYEMVGKEGIVVWF